MCIIEFLFWMMKMTGRYGGWRKELAHGKQK